MKESRNGVMLSSRDYYLIRKWELKGIPESVVRNGISLAVRNHGKSIRSLYSCKDLVEGIYYEYMDLPVRDDQAGKEDINSNPDASVEQLVQDILARTDTAIQNERDQKIRDHYLKFKNKLEYLAVKKRDNLFDLINRLERQFFDEFFSTLDSSEKFQLQEKAESMIPSDTGFLDKQDRDDTIRYFRNELIEKRFNIVNIFDYS